MPCVVKKFPSLLCEKIEQNILKNHLYPELLKNQTFLNINKYMTNDSLKF